MNLNIGNTYFYYESKTGEVLRVIYLINSLKNSGGMERVITVKANLLAEYHDTEVEILTYFDSGQSFYNISDKVKVTNFYEEGVSRKETFGKIIDYINTTSVHVLISTGGKDITIANKINKNIYKILEVHFCFKFPMLREISLKRNSLFLLVGYLKILRNIYFSRRFNLVVALTHRDAERWEKFSGRNSVAIVNPSSFVVNEKEITKIKLDVTRFIAVGRLNEQKNFDSLLLACSNLKNNLKIKNWKLDIYGDGELLGELNNQIKEMNLHNYVTIKKAVSNIEDIYLKSDFLLMTSIYEGLPMVLIEAMTFGVPCVSFDCESGPAEIIENGKNGYLIDKRCTTQFSKMMANCVNMDQKQYKQFSMEAVTTSKNYLPNLVVGQWHKIFSESKK